jgi:REP-associated tyrosine transposase
LQTVRLEADGFANLPHNDEADGLQNRPTERLSMWNLPPPPGFHGLHPDQPVTTYLRHLPHWRQEGATYFVTFRQSDSLPQAKLQELELLRRDWEMQNPPPHTLAALETLSRETMRRVEGWLDQGMGSCVLRDRAAAKKIVDAMHYFDGQRYELSSYVVMPNHVHAIVRPLSCEEEPLERILQSWKRHAARAINRLFGMTGRFWQDESFDRIIRDEEHLWRALQYIGANPKKAGMTRDQCPAWVRPAWVKLGWKFE